MKIIRGCGTRFPGGVYVSCPLGPFGQPIEEFLIDPPLVIDKNALGITPIGVKLIERGGTYHILDWVGEKYYPSVADMIEEIRRFGLSRRLPTNLDFSKLDENSKILLLHSKAHVDNFKAFENVDFKCPKNHPNHNHGELESSCLGLCYATTENGTPYRGFPVKNPQFSYEIVEKPKELIPEFSLAMFGCFPITKFEVVKDEYNKLHEIAVKKTGKSRIPTALVEE